MPAEEAPTEELGKVPDTPNITASQSPSEGSTTSPAEPQIVQPTPLFRTLAMPPPEPEQPPGQDELERRLPGYRRIVIPREMTLIELLKQDRGLTEDEDVLQVTEARLRVVAERVGLRRLSVLVPRLRSLTLDGSALNSLRDLGIGLVHLKFLSVNRCGLNCLDGIWGLSSLREFHAACNKIEDLYPIGALQKLQSLNLAQNPISASVRLWTLSVCGKLQRLTLRGTPVADDPEYRSRVACALPQLLHLDDTPLFGPEGEVGEAIACSDSEEEESQSTTAKSLPSIEPEPGPSSIESCNTIQKTGEIPEDYSEDNKESAEKIISRIRRIRQRPATTENAGVRPSRPELPRRPKTALERPSIDAPSRMQILNTLMEEEWRCSGSRLTSGGAVCGNLARALRRPHNRRRQKEEEQLEMLEKSIGDAARELAAEIPRVPKTADWAKFRLETGIDIDINFDERPQGSDPVAAIERLEQIERETSDRLKRIANGEDVPWEPPSPAKFYHSFTVMNDYDQWKEMNIGGIPHPQDVSQLFAGILNSSEGSTHSREELREDAHMDSTV